MLERLLKLREVEDDSLFLWGGRQTGKSTLLKALFPKARLYDLLPQHIGKQDLGAVAQLVNHEARQNGIECIDNTFAGCEQRCQWTEKYRDNGCHHQRTA